jgi:hypothetical protein
MLRKVFLVLQTYEYGPDYQYYPEEPNWDPYRTPLWAGYQHIPLPPTRRQGPPPSAATGTPTTSQPPLPSSPPPPPRSTSAREETKTDTLEEISLRNDGAEEGEIEDDEPVNLFDITKNSDSEEEQGMPTYREQVTKVRKLRNLPLTQNVDDETSMTLSGSASTRKRFRCSLPAPEGFVKQMDQYVDEIKDVKGGKPHPVGSFPKLYKPRMSGYELTDSWNAEHLQEDVGLSGSALHRGKDPPQVKMRQTTIKGLEAHNRQTLNVSCYTDTFLWSAKQMMRKIRSKLKLKQYEEEPTIEVSGIKELYALTEEAMLFMDNTAQGLQDMAKMTISEVGTLVTLRRDNWIEAMSADLPEEQKFALRQQSLLGKTLFGQDALATATRAAERSRQDKTNEQVKKAVSRTDDRRGVKRPFRDHNDNKRPKHEEKTAFHSFSSYRNPRGKSRGRGGNRGSRHSANNPKSNNNN